MTAMQKSLRPLAGIQAELGEAPLWDPSTRSFYCIDIIRCRLISLDWSNKTTREWPLPALGGALALGRNGRLLVATQTGLFFFDPNTGSYEFFLSPEQGVPANRLNEGKVDPQGRFWIGSISTLDRRPSGSLYRVEPNGRSERVLSDIVVPNCLVWTLDRRRVLFADSFKKVIWSFSYDADSGALGDRQVFADCSDYRGIPDGGAMDAEGFLWNAEFGGGRLIRYTPDGRIDREIMIPTTQITSCAFFGPRLDQIVITTAKRLLSPAQRAEQPYAGDLFTFDPLVGGLPEPEFGSH
jgi:sugar lactone lactonase YvrE